MYRRLSESEEHTFRTFNGVMYNTGIFLTHKSPSYSLKEEKEL